MMQARGNDGAGDGDAPPLIVRRTATELPPDELQGEFARYSIPAGDAFTRITTLQHRYDEEYDAGLREYEEYVRRQQMKKIKEDFDQAGEDMKALELSALARDSKTATLVRQIELNAAPIHLVVRGVAPLTCCALLRAMRDNTNVRTLDLSNNHLPDVIAEPIGKLLRKNRRLRALNLGFNALTAQALAPLGDGLRGNAVLTSLTVESNAIMCNTSSSGNASSSNSSSTSGASGGGSHASAPVSFERFMAAIAHNSTLTALNLFNTQMTIDVGRALARAIEANSSIIALEVGGNAISQSDLAAIHNRITLNQTNLDAAQSKATQIRIDMKQSAEVIQQDQRQLAKDKADAEWHEANARERAEKREKEEWERAHAKAEEDVRVMLEIEAQQKKYLEQMEEKKAKAAKGKK